MLLSFKLAKPNHLKFELESFVYNVWSVALPFGGMRRGRAKVLYTRMSTGAHTRISVLLNPRGAYLGTDGIGVPSFESLVLFRSAAVGRNIDRLTSRGVDVVVVGDSAVGVV